MHEHRSSSQIHTDVVVVGGRAAGASTAMLLARHGLDVVVLERAAAGTDTVSTHALMRPAVQLLHRWGVLDQLIDRGVPPVRSIHFHYADDEVVVPVKESGGVDALYAPRRTLLDPVLADAAAAAGASPRYRTRVVGVRRRGRRVTGVDAIDGSGRHLAIDAGLVIGADGRDSSIARWCSAADSSTTTVPPGLAYIYAHVPGVVDDAYHWCFRPQATAGLIPTNGDASCVFVGLPPAEFGRIRTDVRGSFLGALRACAPVLAERIDPSAALSFRVFPGATGFLRRAQGDGWALVGDAGHFKDPCTAHGITDALRDAQLLADAAVAGLDGDESALAAYELTRDALSTPMFGITNRIASLEWDLEELQQLHLALSSEISRESRALLART